MNQMNVVFLLTIISSSLAAPNTKSIGGRILGGEDAKKGQFPYIASLRFLHVDHNCGGSIISTNVVLTAAHCVYSETASYYYVVVGSVKLSEGGYPYQVAKFIVHEDYDPAKTVNDVALVILAENITLSDNVAIVKLREVDRDEKGECVLAGWGQNGTKETELPDNLQFINLRTTTRKECYDAWESDREIYDNTTCTLTKEGEGACFGDSGGPLVDSEGTQIGIISWVEPCATGMPDVYTRVASFIDWIKKNANLD